MLNKSLYVELSPQKSYPIIIDKDDFGTLEEKVLKYTSACKFLIIINEKVDKLYGNKLKFKNSVKFILRDGEKQKNFKNYQKIINFALKNKLERKDAILAIGGGVVGDIAGFVAATYLRGIDFIQIPTTLLACVDSSVGGKVAINSALGKNMIGAFYQPKAVFCNLNFLSTLDERQFKTGLSEIIKYGLIEKSCQSKFNHEFFDFLIANSDKVLSRDEETLAKLIEISLELKASVVSKDEKEQGLRKILNLGHTYGHAIEKITKYNKFTHGEAVALGIVYAVKLAFKKGLINEDYKNQCINLINQYNLTAKTPKIAPKKLLKSMLSDKKVETGKINFILPVNKSLVGCFEIKPDEILDFN